MAHHLTEALDALQAGQWDRAHSIVQSDASADAAWIHAHLHRIEGDEGNAAYWYRRAGRPAARGSLDEERQAIVHSLTQH